MNCGEYCLALPDTEEAAPFDETMLVYKIAGKMFAMTDMIEADWVALKCDPERAVELREQYDGIIPAFHMNKRHWNGVRLAGDLPAVLVRQMIRESWLTVVAGMPRKIREELTKRFIDAESVLVR